jgi:hypothetical protein
LKNGENFGITAQDYEIEEEEEVEDSFTEVE